MPLQDAGRALQRAGARVAELTTDHARLAADYRATVSVIPRAPAEGFQVDENVAVRS
jgi:hypothetical protein